MFIFADGNFSTVEITGTNCTVKGAYWGGPCVNHSGVFVCIICKVEQMPKTG